ncbi:hypothetical protein [Psychrobacillus vulpis]|uniref:Lipoprotein with Yx(FWY)xxD motif n=1 Tax=Psychrobacillus vulpis TaxID=2325572 RepID=A0A544TKS3_9BACI|nr:hypothetical protein [Psychrobacillus vulpis]TQR18047.1 hypothetical protein FG384_16905 [Psychrobacillus vulpis]
MKKWLFGLLLLTVVAIATGCGASNSEVKKDADKVPASAGPALQVLSNEKVGDYLADDKGMTLYYFKKDEEGKSNCTDDCLANWPIVKAGNYGIPEGYDKNDFGEIIREDNGEKQLTYKGYPLYYFVKDAAKGDVNGEGVKDVWYIINNSTVFK